MVGVNLSFTSVSESKTLRIQEDAVRKCWSEGTKFVLGGPRS